MDASRSLSRPRAMSLTPGDRAALAAHGRPSLLRRLRIQVTAAWSAAASTLVVGLPMIMSEDLTVGDTGVVVTMMSLPAMVVAAHRQGRLARLRADNRPDLSRWRRRPARSDDPAELRELADLRTRLAELVTALQGVVSRCRVSHENGR